VKSNCSPFKLCLCAVFFVVLLRVAIGWHFLYEGVHKFDPTAGFSAEGFLGIAKGPTAEMYYWMLPDLDGLQRLELGTVEDDRGREIDTFIVYENAWKEYFDKYLEKHPDVNREEAEVIFNRYLVSLREGARDVKEDIEAFLASRDRFLENRRTVRNNASFEQQRRWDAMMGYRREAASWVWMLNEMGNGLQSDLGRLADPELAGQRGAIVTAPERELLSPNPLNVQFEVPRIELTLPPANYDLSIKSRMDLMDTAVMFGLSAIGLCLILGFCSRLACLGGAAFLANVVLTTWPVPGVYPEIPSIAGNFMFVSKDVVELVALLFLATIPAGRWAGLDYFLWHCGGKQISWAICYPISRRPYAEWCA
jgi:uncharacterized membrane protein YphA (DoxX/SURF4 family)